MKFVIVLSIVAFACVNAAGVNDFKIPKDMAAEGEAIMKELEAAKVPKLPDGSCFDVCKASGDLKVKAVAFIKKANAAGAILPVANC